MFRGSDRPEVRGAAGGVRVVFVDNGVTLKLTSRVMSTRYGGKFVALGGVGRGRSDCSSRAGLQA